MNIEQLRQSLKLKWLTYYRDNRVWLDKLAVWGTEDGVRRPSSGFILAIVTILEPKLAQLFPLLVDLSNDPDRLITALELDFDPHRELDTLKHHPPVPTQPPFLLTSSEPDSAFSPSVGSFNTVEVEIEPNATPEQNSEPRQSQPPEDESCSGIRPTRQR